MGALYGATPPHFLPGEHHGIYRKSMVVLWPKNELVGPLVRLAGHATWSGGQVSSLHRLWAMDTLSSAFCWTCRQNGFWNCTTRSPAGQGDVAGRPHLGSIEPMLCATSFPQFILSVTMPDFGHNEDTHGFWSIWCFSVIRCS
jgi:hypothetical protein